MAQSVDSQVRDFGWMQVRFSAGQARVSGGTGSWWSSRFWLVRRMMVRHSSKKNLAPSPAADLAQESLVAVDFFWIFSSESTVRLPVLYGSCGEQHRRRVESGISIASKQICAGVKERRMTKREDQRSELTATNVLPTGRYMYKSSSMPAPLDPRASPNPSET